jgi:transposase-like protein
MGAFRRNRVSASKKVIAAGLCNSGYSYRAVSAMLGEISYIAVRDAYFALVTSLPKTEKRSRRSVAIDGEDVLVGGSDYHLWLARDVDSGEILTFQASPEASAEDGTRFLSFVASLCDNRPTLRQGAGHYAPRGLINLDLYFEESVSPSLIGRIGKLLLLTRKDLRISGVR